MKRYVAEPGSELVNDAVSASRVSATAAISRVEVSAAFARAVRMGVLAPDDGRRAAGGFREDWSALLRVPISDVVVLRADELAWEHALRGYDAVQLAAALQWLQLLAEPISFATFDRQLWTAAGRAGLERLPADLPAFLDDRAAR